MDVTELITIIAPIIYCASVSNNASYDRIIAMTNVKKRIINTNDSIVKEDVLYSKWSLYYYY